MASDPVRLQRVKAAPVGRPFGIWPLLLVPLVLVGAGLAARTAALQPPNVISLTGAVDTMTPADLTATAATELERALGQNGTGITFEIVQRQTVHARPDGAELQGPDPSDPTKVIAVESAEIGTLVERGLATVNGFWSEILVGPAPGDDPARYDLDNAETRRSALVHDGEPWRNDGDGWGPADLLPGIGLDPATLGTLPDLLTGAQDARDAEAKPAEPWADLPGLREPAPTARSLETDVQAERLPGVIAADAAGFTEISEAARLAFDDAGRLIGMTVVARNTSMSEYDLIVETVYTFTYPTSPPDLPKPEPRDASAPTDGEAGS